MKHFLGYCIGYFAFFFGGGALAGFSVFLMSGGIQIVNFGFDESGILFFDAGLSLIFFVQHSLMMRKPFQEKAKRVIPSAYYPAVYAIVSGITLISLLVLWQVSGVTIYVAQSPASWVIRLLFFIVGICFMCGAAALGGFDPFGVKNIKNHLSNKPICVNPFVVQGPYRLVRHPLYSCSIVMIWLCPSLTAERLAFNILWTVWIVIGAILEERDLVDVFGDDYLKYQEKVPMLLPVRRPLIVTDPESSD